VKKIVACAAMGLMLVGCAANQKNKTAAAGMSMDISAPAPQYVPQTAQPVIYDAPPQAAAPAAPALAAAPSAAESGAEPAAPSTSAGRRYTVKKGDTLWKIAETRYGNGNQWQRIASANPGLEPETLKIGQRIAIP
jgi:5'-nucleotidase